MLMLPVGSAHTVDWRLSQVAHLMASDRYISGANDEAALSEDWRIRAVPTGVLKLARHIDRHKRCAREKNFSHSDCKFIDVKKPCSVA